MIRAIMFTPNLSVGGAERWVVSLIKHSDPARVKWHGVVVSGWGGLDPELCEELTQYCPIFSEKKIDKTMKRNHPTPAAKSPDCERYITRCKGLPAAVAAAGYQADVMVAWGAHQYANFLKPLGAPKEMVLVSHSSHHKPHSIPNYKHCKLHLTAVSEAARRPFHTDKDVDVIYNGCQTDRLEPIKGRLVQRAKWGATDSYKIIGYIGRRTTEKHPAAAAMAVRELGFTEWAAVYYGNLPPGQRHLGRQEKLVMEWAKEQDPYIQFFEPTMQIGDVYAGIDVLMLASHSEAFSLTLLEAFYCGVPVVATPVGSVPELQREYGELVIEVPKKATPAQLAEACERAISPEGQAIAARARDVATAHFTAEMMASNWADYLEAKVTPRKPPRKMVLEL